MPVSESSVADSSSSSSAVKFPLTVKKAIRDKESLKGPILSALTPLFGATTFTWPIESAWVALDGHAAQRNLVDVVIEEYLPAVVDAISYSCKDELVLAQLKEVWSTRNISFIVLPHDWQTKPAPGTDTPLEASKLMFSWNGYNGMRLTDGTLEIYVYPSTFWTRVRDLEMTDFAVLLANAPGSLPLALRKQIRDTKAARVALEARIAKATGVDEVKWDVERDAIAILARGDPKYKFTVGPAIQYMEALAGLFEKRCTDGLVKQAVTDTFTAKAVGLKVIDNMEVVKGEQEMHTSYNGIQFTKSGEIFVFTTPEYWHTNVSQLSNFDIISLF